MEAPEPHCRAWHQPHGTPQESAQRGRHRPAAADRNGTSRMTEGIDRESAQAVFKVSDLG